LFPLDLIFTIAEDSHIRKISGASMANLNLPAGRSCRHPALQLLCDCQAQQGSARLQLPMSLSIVLLARYQSRNGPTDSAEEQIFPGILFESYLIQVSTEKRV
jgi:hypothetical protein